MRPHTLIMVIVAFVLATTLSNPGSVSAQECVEIYCRVFNPGEPACWTPSVGHAVRFTSSPTSTSAGSCFGNSLDHQYTGVDFFHNCSQSTAQATCTVFASSSALSGKYEITQVSGDCFVVCALCP